MDLFSEGRCAIDNSMDAAEVFFDSIDNRVYLVGIADIHRIGTRIPANGFYIANDFVGDVLFGFIC